MRARRAPRSALLGALAAVVLTGSAAGAAGAPAATASLRVRGTELVDGAGRSVRLLGVNRSGLEYACIQGWGFFDSPHPDEIDTPAMIAAMKSWRINAVRVPLNEDCWLGVNAPSGRGGAPYRAIVARYVHALVAAGLYVILDLHWTAPGALKATGQEPMPDADHAPAFWRSVARTFKGDHASSSTSSTSPTESIGPAGATAAWSPQGAAGRPTGRRACRSSSTPCARPERASPCS